MIIENCPICKNKLRTVQDNENPDFIDNWFCGTCGIVWDLEELEYIPEQKSVNEYL